MNEHQKLVIKRKNIQTNRAKKHVRLRDQQIWKLKDKLEHRKPSSSRGATKEEMQG